jgi:hypothetical protein
VGLAIYRGRHGDAALERTIGAVMSWADEYRAGDHEGVWRKLTELGPGLRQDCAAWDDATEVARETMRHVRANVERLHAALLEDGYRFDRPDDALVAPAADAHDRLDQVERVVGPLPLSLRGWFEVVGSVNFVGVHPEWDFEYADPLVVDCPIDHIVREYEEREASGWFEEEDTDRFPLDLAPDYLHKADVSGGAPYSIWVPDAAADARWEFDDLHETAFVGYLRSALLDWGGFPGWARRVPAWAAPTEPWPPLLADLTARFERF